MSESVVLIDAGPMVAMLREDDEHHAWAAQTAEPLPTPLITCEACVTEAFFLLRRHGDEGVVGLWDLLRRRVVVVTFSVPDHLEPLAALMRKYADSPMSLADACLVRMAETVPRSVVFTLDAHFRVYRKRSRQQIPVIIPPGR